MKILQRTTKTSLNRSIRHWPVFLYVKKEASHNKVTSFSFLFFCTFHILSHYLLHSFLSTAPCDFFLFLVQFCKDRFFGTILFLFRCCIIFKSVNHIVICFLCNFRTSQVFPIFQILLPVIQFRFTISCLFLHRRMQRIKNLPSFVSLSSDSSIMQSACPASPGI